MKGSAADEKHAVSRDEVVFSVQQHLQRTRADTDQLVGVVTVQQHPMVQMRGVNAASKYGLCSAQME